LVALSTGLFVRKVGGSAAAAVLAAALFTLQGTSQWLFQPLLLEAVAWLPLGCVAVIGIVRGEGRRTVALLAATTGASLLTGGVQCTAFLLYAWTALLAAGLLTGRASLARTAIVPARFVAALVLGFLMAAVQILPTMELTQHATRATGSLTMAKMFPFGYAGFDLLRRSVTGGDPPFGVISLVLTPVALVAGRPRWLVLWALVVGGALAFGVAMGPVTPLFDAYFAIPVLSWFRTPQRILILANFCLAVLAALGLDVVTGKDERSHRWILPVGTLACTIVLLGALTVPGATLPALLVAVTAGVLARAWRSPSLAAALVGVGVLQAFAPRPHWGQLPYGAGALKPYDAHGAAYAKLAAAQGSDRVWVVRTVDHPSFAAKLYSRFRVRGLDDYESMNLRRQAEYFDYAMYGSTNPPTRAPFLGRVFPVPTRDGGRVLAAHRRLLDLMAVRLVHRR
jgi:hypothetical protein